MTSCHTRPPAVAGCFYPADPRQLRTEVAILLTNAAIETRSSPPKALIAPYAGYAYSGAIAAAFATVRERAEAVTRIVLVGSAHHTSVLGIAVPTVLALETPLGSVAVDQASLATISDLPVVVYDNAVHVPEHALEVELPFLQSTIGAFMLVPLLVGDATPQQVALILDRLSSGPETMIVVSSDLSHYLASDAALRRDAATAAAIERGDWVGLGRDDADADPSRGSSSSRIRRGLPPGGSTCAIPAIPPVSQARRGIRRLGVLARWLILRRHKLVAGWMRSICGPIAPSGTSPTMRRQVGGLLSEVDPTILHLPGIGSV